MDETKKNSVLIAVPSRNAYLHARLVQALVPQLKKNPFIIMAGVSPVALARNKIVETFLKSEASHLFMVDDDTIPPMDVVEKLLAHDKDIVSGVTPILREGNMMSNVYLDTSGDQLPLDHKLLKAKELFKVEGVGSSCLLIKREVFDKIGKPWFAEVWGQDGTHMSEDIFFCNRAKEEGLEVLIDPTVVCKHARTIVI